MWYIGYAFDSYITDLLKVWLILWGIMNFSPVKKKSTYIIWGTSQTILLVIAGLLFKEHYNTVIFVLIFMVLITITFLLEGKFYKNFAYALLAYLLMLFLDGCLNAILELINLKSSDTGAFYLYNVINVLILSVAVFLKRRKKRTSVQITLSKRIYALLFSGAGTGFVITVALLVRSNDKATEMARGAMILVSIIAVISYCAACFMMVVITESRDNYKTLSLINQGVIESQQKYYTLVNEKQQEIRSIRHDMKNHLACIHGLYMAGKLSEMEQYISQLIEASDISTNLFDSGNDIVNAILNDAQSRYINDNIGIRLEGGFPVELHIAPLDLCVIFANIITNAIESIQRIERRDDCVQYVDVKISSYKDDLFIDIKNPVGEKIKIIDGSLVTSKKDKSMHGFGVNNIIQRVEKYHGTYNFKTENSQFMVEIQMKNRV